SADISNIRIRNGVCCTFWKPMAGIVDTDSNQSIWMVGWKWPQQHRAPNAKHRPGDSDAQRDSYNPNGCKPGIAGELTQCIPKVLGQRIHHRSSLTRISALPSDPPSSPAARGCNKRPRLQTPGHPIRSET